MVYGNSNKGNGKVQWFMESRSTIRQECCNDTVFFIFLAACVMLNFLIGA